MARPKTQYCFVDEATGGVDAALAAAMHHELDGSEFCLPENTSGDKAFAAGLSTADGDGCTALTLRELKQMPDSPVKPEPGKRALSSDARGFEAAEAKRPKPSWPPPGLNASSVVSQPGQMPWVKCPSCKSAFEWLPSDSGCPFPTLPGSCHITDHRVDCLVCDFVGIGFDVTSWRPGNPISELDKCWISLDGSGCPESGP